MDGIQFSTDFWLRNEWDIKELATHTFSPGGWDQIPFNGYEFVYFISYKGTLLYVGITRRAFDRFVGKYAPHEVVARYSYYVVVSLIPKIRILKALGMPMNLTLEVVETLLIDLCRRSPYVTLDNKLLAQKLWISDCP